MHHKTIGVKVKEVMNALERFAPLPLQEEYDNAGLQLGLKEVEVSGALLCLDVTEDVLAEAVTLGCNMVISHHPLLFRALKNITDATLSERCVRYALKHDLIIYSAHTNLDNAEGGVNAEAARHLGLKDIQFLQSNEVYLIVKPEVLCDAAKYIETGEYDSGQSQLEFMGIDLSELEDMTTSPKRVIKSSSNARDKFHEERDKKFKKEKRSAK